MLLGPENIIKKIVMVITTVIICTIVHNLYYTVNTTAYKYYFNGATMMDYYCLLLIKRINTSTIYYAYYGLTITITKQCGGTPVSSSASVFINLEKRQEKLEIALFHFMFRYYHFYASMEWLMAPSLYFLILIKSSHSYC